MSELSLNQFEQDRAVTALRYKNLNIRNLCGKTVFIAGSTEVTFSLVTALLTVNDSKNADITVVLLNDSNKILYKSFDKLSDRDDFKRIDLSDLSDCRLKADLLVETGFLLPDKLNSTEDFKYYISRTQKILSAVEQLNIPEVVLLSDASVYGRIQNNLAVSENEAVCSDLSADSLKPMLIQSVENLYFSASHAYGFIIKTVRCAKIISEFSNSEFVRNMRRSAVAGGSVDDTDHVEY